MASKWDQFAETIALYFGKAARGFENDKTKILEFSSESQALYLHPIDWMWGADDKEIDQHFSDYKYQYLGRCNQVDALIREAGMLLERALKDVEKYDDLKVDSFKLCMEFLEFFRMANQQDIEDSDLPFSLGLAYEAENHKNVRTKASGDAEVINKDYVGAYTEYYNNQIHANTYTANAAILLYKAQVDANASEAQSYSAREEYERKSREYLTKRRQISREIKQAKLKECTKHLGALNYPERMNEIAKRALADYKEALARLYAIALGLREFYSTESPSEADLEADLKSSRSRIEGAVTWIRKATNAFARAALNEQTGVVRLTIQPPEQGTLFQKLQNGPFLVPFPASSVAHMTRAGLRGLSATAESLSKDSWIGLELTCPEQKLGSGADTLPQITSRLGRTSSSASLNVRDIVGGRTIINRSPVGDWTVRLINHDRGEQITRLHLDFHLSFSSEK